MSRVLVTFLLLLMTLSLSAEQGEIPELSLSHNDRSLSSFPVAFFDDETGELKEDRFKHQHLSRLQSNFALGSRRGVQWFAMVVYNRDELPLRRYLKLSERFYEEADLYTYDLNGTLLHVSRSGQQVALGEREIDNPSFVYRIDLQPGQKQLLLLRIRSTAGSYGEITLHDEADLQKTMLLELVLFIFFIGAAVSVSLYTFLIFGFLREKVYLYYSGYILLFALLVFVFSGNMSYLAGWESSTRFFAIVPAMNALFILLSRVLLSLPGTLPRVNRMVVVLLYLMLLDIVLIMIWPDKSADFVAFTLLFVYPALVVGSVMLVFKGDKVATIYLIALTVFLMSMMLIVFISLGVIPYYHRELAYLPLAASLVEFMLIFVALGMRIDQLRREGKRLKAQLIEHLQSQSKELQTEVEKRTIELNLALEERHTLYRELQHRVKNNFQTILSYIWLQKQKDRHPESSRSLTSIQIRVDAMSTLYNMLFPSNYSRTIELSDYAEKLVQNVERSFGSPNIKITFDCPDITTTVEQAMVLGQLMNELLSNAYKHAFSADHTGVVNVKIEKTSQKKMMLRITDNGQCTLPLKKGLGWTLIDELVRRLPNAELRYRCKEGLTVEVVFDQ